MLELTALLLTLKVVFPNRVHILRGKHECRSIGQVYGFFDRCNLNYDRKTWEAFMNVFDKLPLAAVIDEKVTAMAL